MPRIKLGTAKYPDASASFVGLRIAQFSREPLGFPISTSLFSARGRSDLRSSLPEICVRLHYNAKNTNHKTTYKHFMLFYLMD